jgi:hypothetical protein
MLQEIVAELLKRQLALYPTLPKAVQKSIKDNLNLAVAQLKTAGYNDIASIK